MNGQAVIPGNGMLAAACSSTSCRGSGHRRFLARAICAWVRSATSERNIDVYADAGRRLPVADPAGRELMISYGAAVFTLRVALRYLGSLPHVRLFPDSFRPALVARVSWGEDRIAADSCEREIYAAVTARRTHRGGFGPAPLSAGTISALRTEAAREGAMLRLVAAGDQRDALAAAVQAGEHALRLNGSLAAELADWVVAPGSARRDGVPPAAYPAEPAHTEPDFPGRDFAPGSSAPPPAEWPRPCTASRSLPQLRDFIRVQLAARAHPQMIIRLGVTSQAGTGTGSIRRPVGEILLAGILHGPDRRRQRLEPA